MNRDLLEQPFTRLVKKLKRMFSPAFTDRLLPAQRLAFSLALIHTMPGIESPKMQGKRRWTGKPCWHTSQDR